MTHCEGDELTCNYRKTCNVLIDRIGKSSAAPSVHSGRLVRLTKRNFLETQKSIIIILQRSYLSYIKIYVFGIQTITLKVEGSHNDISMRLTHSKEVGN